MIAPVNQIEKLDSISFDKLLETQNPLEQSAPRFDLTGTRLITASALVSLAAVCHAMHRERRQPTIVLDNPSVRSYLVRSGFVSVLSQFARFEPLFPAHAPAVF